MGYKTAVRLFLSCIFFLFLWYFLLMAINREVFFNSYFSIIFCLTVLGSVGYRPSSSLRTYAEEHLVFRKMKDNHTQQTGIQIHSTTSTGRGDFSANELGTSGKCMRLCVCSHWHARVYLVCVNTIKHAELCLLLITPNSVS